MTIFRRFILVLAKNVRLVLLPFAFLYGCLVLLHRSWYKKGLGKSSSFTLPLITVGNLSVGGTGKSPHIEFLYELLQTSAPLGILSRGYHRKSRGVKEVHCHSSAEEVGDEPLQFKLKYPEATVVVAEKRALGVEKIQALKPTVQTILLDDAFQHWAIEVPIQILLTTFEQPFYKDWLLPVGRLREFRSGYQRADIIVVTKCPFNLSHRQRQIMLEQLQPLAHQQVFFSYFEYQNLYNLLEPKASIEITALTNVLVVTAIANTVYLEQYLQQYHPTANYLRFPDHHYFETADLDSIKKQGHHKCIVVTEKDATKLLMHEAYLKKHQLDIYVLPIKVQLAFDEEKDLKQALEKLLEQQKNSC